MNRKDALRGAHVAVLCGGRSTEHAISLASGALVHATLAERKAELRALSRIEIDTSGLWRVGERELPPADALAALRDVDVYFLALHGGAGEDGRIQGFLEVAGKHFTGPGVGACAAAMDKLHGRAIAASAGLRVAQGFGVDAGAWSTRREAILRAAAEIAESGLVVKPRHGGSSVGLSLLDGPAEVATDLGSSVLDLLDAGEEALIEERLLGVEISCAVDAERAYTPIEIQPQPGRVFDYDQKYSADGADEFCPPRSLNGSEQREIQDAARAAFDAFGCAGVVRVDFFKEPGSGRPAGFLELNSLPGLTDRSLVRLATEHDGVAFDELCLQMLGEALARGTSPAELPSATPPNSPLG